MNAPKDTADPAVAVAVHNHVHLAGAGHAVVGVCAVEVAVGQFPEAGLGVPGIEVALQPLVFLAEQFGAFGGREFLLFQAGFELRAGGAGLASSCTRTLAKKGASTMRA